MPAAVVAFRVALAVGNASVAVGDPGLAILLRCALSRTAGVPVGLIRLRSVTDTATGAVMPLAPGSLANSWTNCDAAEGAPPPNWAAEAAALGVPLTRRAAAGRGLAGGGGVTVAIEIIVPASGDAPDPGGLGAGVVAAQNATASALVAALAAAFSSGAATADLGIFLTTFAAALGTRASAVLAGLSFSPPVATLPALRSPTPSPLPPPLLSVPLVDNAQSTVAFAVAVPLLLLAAALAGLGVWHRRHARLQREAMAAITSRVGAHVSQMPTALAKAPLPPHGGARPLLGHWAPGGAFGGATYTDDPHWGTQQQQHQQPRRVLLAPPTALATRRAVFAPEHAPLPKPARRFGQFSEPFWGRGVRVKRVLRSTPPREEEGGGGWVAPAAARAPPAPSLSTALLRLFRLHGTWSAPPPPPQLRSTPPRESEEGAWRTAPLPPAPAHPAGVPAAPAEEPPSPHATDGWAPPAPRPSTWHVADGLLRGGFRAAAPQRVTGADGGGLRLLNPLFAPPAGGGKAGAPPAPTPLPALSPTPPALPAAHRLRAAALGRNALALAAAASPEAPAVEQSPLRAARGALMAPGGGAAGFWGGAAAELPGGAI
jgi:hypothetical protein